MYGTARIPGRRASLLLLLLHRCQTLEAKHHLTRLIEVTTRYRAGEGQVANQAKEKDEGVGK